MMGQQNQMMGPQNGFMQSQMMGQQNGFQRGQGPMGMQNPMVNGGAMASPMNSMMGGNGGGITDHHLEHFGRTT